VQLVKLSGPGRHPAGHPARNPDPACPGCDQADCRHPAGHPGHPDHLDHPDRHPASRGHPVLDYSDSCFSQYLP